MRPAAESLAFVVYRRGTSPMTPNEKLPPEVERAIELFVDSAKSAFESDLVSIVLYGSGAEGRLRATSDVNTLLVLKRFEQARVDLVRRRMIKNNAAAALNTMFLLESELPAAMEAFAVKFADIL